MGAHEIGTVRPPNGCCARSVNPSSQIASIWRETEDVGEAYTMLTMEPGPDMAPYHDRQIVIVERDSWADWPDPSVSAKPLIKPAFRLDPLDGADRLMRLSFTHRQVFPGAAKYGLTVFRRVFRPPRSAPRVGPSQTGVTTY